MKNYKNKSSRTINYSNSKFKKRINRNKIVNKENWIEKRGKIDRDVKGNRLIVDNKSRMKNEDKESQMKKTHAQNKSIEKHQIKFKKIISKQFRKFRKNLELESNNRKEKWKQKHVSKEKNKKK